MEHTTSPKPEYGAVLPAAPCGWTEEDQRHIHECCGLEAVDRDADPVLLAVGGVHQVGHALLDHLPQLGPVITRQILTVKRLTTVGAPVFIAGHIKQFDDVSRGILMATDFQITGDTGEDLAELQITLLLIDPDKSKQAAGRKKPKRPPADVAETIEILGKFTCTPETTRTYELDAPPSLHTDVALAADAGFPKPIVSGNQVFGIIWNRFVKSQYQLPISLDFTLGRPIFWDDEISFVRVAPSEGEHARIEVRNANQQVSITGRVFGALKS
jgi:hypothetical protein